LGFDLSEMAETFKEEKAETFKEEKAETFEIGGSNESGAGFRNVYGFEF